MVQFDFADGSGKVIAGLEATFGGLGLEPPAVSTSEAAPSVPSAGSKLTVFSDEEVEAANYNSLSTLERMRATRPKEVEEASALSPWLNLGKYLVDRVTGQQSY